ncbi:hypothetical protein D3C73_1317280 [compost metagenome]
MPLIFRVGRPGFLVECLTGIGQHHPVFHAGIPVFSAESKQMRITQWRQQDRVQDDVGIFQFTSVTGPARVFWRERG